MKCILWWPKNKKAQHKLNHVDLKMNVHLNKYEFDRNGGKLWMENQGMNIKARTLGLGGGSH